MNIRYASLPALFVLFFMSACNDSAKGPVVSGPLTKQIEKPFSDLVKADTFKVELTGTDPKAMILHFKIVNFEGKEIYNKDLAAPELLDNYKESVDLSKEDTQRSFIKDEFEHFLDDENFLEPAVTENENADQHAPDHVFYNELKETGLNGFKIRTTKESKIYIGWSAKEKQVRVYYTCC